MKTHKLKTWPSYFEAVRSGAKRFEARKNDRDFATGDLLHLIEYDPAKEVPIDDWKVTGRSLTVSVEFVLHGGSFGIAPGYCVMSIYPVGLMAAEALARSQAVRLIAEERARHISGEGWTADHDDAHTDGSLAVNAAILACEGTDAHVVDAFERTPWTIKRPTRKRALVIAGSLIAAELDREIRQEKSDR